MDSGCRRSLADGVEADGQAECVGLFGDAAHDLGGLASGEVVGSEFEVVEVVHEHVPDRGEQGMLDRDDGSLFASSGSEAVVAFAEVGVFLSGPRPLPRCLGQLRVLCCRFAGLLAS